MEDAERPRARPGAAWRQLWHEDRLLLGRFVFWSVVVGVWTVFHLLWRLRVLRSRFWS